MYSVPTYQLTSKSPFPSTTTSARHRCSRCKTDMEWTALFTVLTPRFGTALRCKNASACAVRERAMFVNATDDNDFFGDAA